MSNVGQIAAQAANTITDTLNVEDVFSTYLYTGNGSSKTITNGINLSGEGGLVWIKSRSSSVNSHKLFDTERGALYKVHADETVASTEETDTLSSFNEDGFSILSDTAINGSSAELVSWTFRKAPKFFDVVTYTGDGTDNRAIAHNLNGKVGFIAVKRTNVAGDNWTCYHRGILGPSNTGVSAGRYTIPLNETNARYDSEGGQSKSWGNRNPTDTHFYVDDLGTTLNESGSEYVAYLWAHNEGDGNFGPDGDKDIIKCGTYTGNGTADHEVYIGFEPQWIMIKRVDSADNWCIVDNMRGFTTDGSIEELRANTPGSESAKNTKVGVLSDGIKFGDADGQYNTNNGVYIYVAIRRGPMAIPTDATDVFDIHTESSSAGTYTNTTGWPVDFQLQTATGTGIHRPYDRLRGGARYLDTASSNAEQTGGTAKFDNNTGYTNSTSIDLVDWLWRRAPHYFDIVTYVGDGVSGREVAHNLGVVPEMMWFRRRNAIQNWLTYLPTVGPSQFITLNNNSGPYGDTALNRTYPTDSVFTVGNATEVNTSGSTYVVYLFASLAGISKIGTFISDGTDMTIDCGFTAGARFVLLRKISAGDDWFVWDTERGIVEGNDKRIKLNGTTGQATGSDNIDPDNSGFIINNNILGGSGNTFMFYAIA